MDAYNRVQAVERALGRVQNYVSELADAGVKLAALSRPTNSHGSPAQWAFEAMRDARVISSGLCRRLVQGPERPENELNTATSKRPRATSIARRSWSGTRLAISWAPTEPGSSPSWHNQSRDRASIQHHANA